MYSPLHEENCLPCMIMLSNYFFLLKSYAVIFLFLFKFVLFSYITTQPQFPLASILPVRSPSLSPLDPFLLNFSSKKSSPTHPLGIATRFSITSYSRLGTKSHIKAGVGNPVEGFQEYKMISKGGRAGRPSSLGPEQHRPNPTLPELDPRILSQSLWGSRH